MIERFKGEAHVAVGQRKDGTYVVMLTLADLPTEQYARKIAALIEDAVAEKVRAIGGKLEGWE